MNEGSGTSKRMKSWDADCLQKFKQKFKIDNISAIIIDEISIKESSVNLQFTSSLSTLPRLGTINP